MFNSTRVLCGDAPKGPRQWTPVGPMARSASGTLACLEFVEGEFCVACCAAIHA